MLPLLIGVGVLTYNLGVLNTVSLIIVTTIISKN